MSKIQPKLIFLGTGGDSIVVGKQMRASGGIVLQTETSQLHIDPGPGSLVMAKAMNISPRNTTAIVCTHDHINHSNDVNALISALTHAGMDHYGVFLGSKSVVSGTEEYPPILGKYTHKWLEKVITLEPGKKAGVNDIDINAVATKHSDETAVGLKITTPQFTIGYTSDTDYTSEMIQGLKETDILILNVVAPFDTSIAGQLSSDDAVKIIDAVKPGLAVITHFGVKLLAADPLLEAREIQKRTKVQTVAAKDGLVINPVSYSANIRQKTLKHF